MKYYYYLFSTIRGQSWNTFYTQEQNNIVIFKMYMKILNKKNNMSEF